MAPGRVRRPPRPRPRPDDQHPTTAPGVTRPEASATRLGFRPHDVVAVVSVPDRTGQPLGRDETLAPIAAVRALACGSCRHRPLIEIVMLR